MKRLLALLLAVLMFTSNSMSVLAEVVPALREPSGEPAEAQAVELETEDLDPATLHIKKIGEIGEDEETGEEEEPALVYGPNDLVRVSIVLDQPSALEMGYATDSIGKGSDADAYRNSLKQQQKSVERAISTATGSPLDVKWNLTLAVNIISANVRYRDIPVIGNVAGVTDVVIENRYEPETGSVSDPNTSNTSAGMVGATGAWADGYSGAGSRIAIIDTGLDTSHQSFNEDAFLHSIDELGARGELMQRSDIPSSGLNISGASYVSAKVPYAYNYVDRNTTVTHLNDTQGEHGSHVAGIAAANRYIKNGNSYVDAATNVHAVGMAPDAQLLIMKVFGSSGGAYDSDYMAAIEDALVLQCDSVNLSLGSGSQGWTYSDAYQNVMNKLTNSQYNTKTVVTISAGNSYALTEFMGTELYYDDIDLHTGGSPGSFINSLGVAAAQNIGVTGSPLTFNGNKTVYYNETDLTGSRKAMTSVAGNWSYVYIDALGEAADYSAVNSATSLSGKVVIVNRGSISFVDKGNNASSYNPKAVIIANNEGGTLNMGLDDYTGSAPVVSITLADAEAIKAGGTAHTTGSYTYYTGTVQVHSDISTDYLSSREDAEVTDFSSWGVPGSLLMKPEITAPGGDIYSVAGTHRTKSGTNAGGSDQYETMSGTSMAAPHMAGLAAVVGEFLREKDLSANTALTSSYNTRAINQSLLMSSATPMKNNGNYVSILQQGAGLANVQNAVESRVAVFVGGDTLTTDTGAAADGKVKAEFGDKPSRTGTYQYTFTAYNLTDEDIEYTLSTDLFTQGVEEKDGEKYMSRGTTALDWNVSYSYSGVVTAGHDVDRDGDTDAADAQALLDYLTGVNNGSALDLAAGEMDNDGTLTTYDAYLLLGWEGTSSDGFIVPANGSNTATVTISIPSDTSALDADHPAGAYVEGFTYLRSSYTTGEGEIVNEEHSIPLLGFYGNWTDPSMFDNTSYVDTLYHTEKTPYTGNTITNYMTVTENGVLSRFTGNPYMVEEVFPAERLAINSHSKIGNIVYNLYRPAGTTGFAMSRIDERGGSVTSVLTSAVTANNVEGIWYYQSQEAWQNMGTKFYSVSKTPGSVGLSEGDLFRVGYYAIPEYNAIRINSDKTSSTSGQLNANTFKTVLQNNDLGLGAFVGYDLVVDDTEPVIGTPTLNGSDLTVSASDNMNLAYVAVLSLDGQTVYAEAAPGSDTFSVTFDASEAIATAHGYVAVFAGDYAGNEVAKAVRVNDDIYEERTYYVLTSTLTAGEDYLIVERNTVGSGHALGHTGTTIATNPVTVNAADSTINAPYINSSDVAATSIWTVANGNTFKNGNYYLRRNSNNGTTLQAGTNNTYNTWSWDANNNRLSMTISNRSYYLRYNNSTFSLSTTANSVYLYKKTVVRVEVDPYHVSSVSVTPASLELYKGNETDLVAKVLPLTAEDRTVVWSSSNTSVATVDANGHVTAVGAGTATITATSNGDPTKSATCSVNVLSVNKTLSAVIWDEEGGVYFSTFNANSLPTWTKRHADSKGLQLQSNFMSNASTLYTATLDTSTAETVLYSVNRNNYNLTQYGVNYLWATDMAIGSSSSTYANYVGFAYTFGTYAVAGPIAPGDDGEGGTYSGLPYAATNFSDTTGGAYLAGIACRSRSTYGGTYYLLDENGVIWETTLTLNGNSFSFGALSKKVETGISTSFLYQTLYYDGTYLYWGHTSDNVAELIIINPSSGAVYHAGNFGEGIWPAAGFYVDGSVAPASADDEITEAELPELSLAATRDELMTEEVMTRFAAEAEKMNSSKLASMLPEQQEVAEEPVTEEPTDPVTEETEEPVETEEPDETEEPAEEEPAETEEPADESGDPDEEEPIAEEEEPSDGETGTDQEEPAEPSDEETTDEGGEAVNPAFGGTNALAGWTSYTGKQLANPLRPSADLESVNPTGSDADVTRTVTISEAQTVTNGLYEITYDPSKVSVSAESSSFSYTSLLNEGDGTIKFAFARDPKGTEGTEVLVLTFSAVGCDAIDNVTAKTTELGQNFNHENGVETTTFAISPVDHDWNDPTYVWSDDNSSVTATRICRRNDTHVETETVNTTSEVTTPATCTTAGKTTYTATFENTAFETQTKTVENIEATGHDWNDPTYVWADDNSSVTATRVCRSDESHVETETVNTMSEVTTPATCTAAGKTTYTATFENTAFETQTKTVENIEATGHDWNDPTYTWSDDNSTVTATRVCRNDASHVETETVNTTAEVTKPATCTEKGETTYTATFANTVFETQTKTVADIEATGHSWEDPTYVWADDNSTVTAARVCRNDASHVETETVDTTSEVTTPATCTTTGKTTYTATFENAAFETQTRTVENIDATGHAYGAPDWAWAEDYSSATATFTCANDESHVETVAATVTHETQEDRSTVHTATVVFQDETYTDTVIEPAPALALNVRDQDSTDGVELAWDEVPGAVEYHVYEVGDSKEILLTITGEAGYLDGRKLVMGETYTYLVTACDENGKVLVEEEHEDFFNPFRDDVADDSPSFEYIAWAYNNDIVKGTSHTTFDPEGHTTRMNFVMMLYKMHGSPKVSGTNPFKDVTGSKSVKAVLWAYNKGLVKGTDKTHFSPDVDLSRMNIIMILYKLAGSPSVSGSNPFTDISGSKTIKAVTWAVKKGIITGVDDTHFDPDGACSRALFVEVLCKYNRQYPII